MTPHNREELLYKLAGRTVVCSVSGGKDSTAMALYLTRDLKLPDVRFVFADTGWEHPDTYAYIKDVLAPLLGHIEWVGYPGGMRSLVTKKGTFPSRLRRFCTEELKVKPILRYLRQVEACGDSALVVNAVGIRAGESQSRSRMGEWEWNDTYDCDIWRPLIAWTEAEVIDCHKRHGLAPNPLYLKGASRVGCHPCIFQTKAQIAWFADHHAGQIGSLKALELALSVAAEEPRAWFQSSTPGPDGKYPLMKISDAIGWARTSRGGRQYQLFMPDTEPGCVRWGLCESMQKDDAP
jgi:3'-phosphoadenosine 5'-phosphosulfate sulfotransferase (PAPS reductase)/FAD synthetase